MKEAEGLLRAIQDSPDEDAPRLIYADWFEDQGDLDRAEFIRVQCRLARMSLYDPARPVLLRREYDLLSRHGNVWSKPLIGRVRRWRYRRGFVEQVKAEVEVFSNHAEMLWGNYPVRELHLTRSSAAEVRKLASSPWLAHVEALDLSNTSLGDKGLLALLGSTYLLGLRRLALSFCDLRSRGVRELARTEQLPALEELDLSGNELGAALLAEFVQRCELPRLQRLVWDRDDCTEEFLTALADSALVSRLKVLDNLGWESQEEDLAPLIRARLDRVEEMDLGRSQLSMGMMLLMSLNESMRGLRRLDLTDNGIGDEGVAVLVNAPLAETLEELSVSGCGITEKGARELARSSRIGRLRLLDLSENRIGEAGVAALAESTTLRSLLGLRLRDCRLSSIGAEAILQSGFVGRLGELDVRENDALGAWTINDLAASFGEALQYDGMDAYYTARWVQANTQAHPPRCLSGFVARGETALARQLHRRHLDGGMDWVVLELSHADPAQRPVLLGYAGSAFTVYTSLSVREAGVFLSPVAVRWEPCGEVVELFDAEQHGYAGEYDSNTEATGTGERGEWRCPHAGCQEHVLLACFRYGEQPPERHRDRYFPPQDQFRHFLLYAYCSSRQKFERVLEAVSR